MMRWWWILALLVLAGCSKGPEGPPPAPALTPGTGEIRAGDGVDQVKLGQSQAEVEKLLGPPSEKDANEFNKSQTYGLYHDKGLEIAYDSGKVGMIVCHADGPPWTPYTGKTPQGLWAGSSAEEIKEALGEPKEAQGQALQYGKLGIWFTFTKDAKVETIRITPPQKE